MTERELLAAEYALGLLEGEALLEARGLLVTDPLFAANVAAWEARFAGMLDEIDPIAPPAELWSRIASAQHETAPAEVVVLRRRIRRWQAATALAAAAALATAVFTPIFTGQRGEPVQAQPPRPLVATLGIEGQHGSLALTYLPQSRELLVTAAAVSADPVHDHELWLLPSDGKPVSLGILRTPTGQRIGVDPRTASLIGNQSAIAVSAEPKGGSPTGAPTGPVVATGKLSPV